MSSTFLSIQVVLIAWLFHRYLFLDFAVVRLFCFIGGDYSVFFSAISNGVSRLTVLVVQIFGIFALYVRVVVAILIS